VSKELLETGMLSVFVFVRWSKEAIRRHWPALGKGILIKSGTGVRRWCILWGSGRPKMEIPVQILTHDYVGVRAQTVLGDDRGYPLWRSLREGQSGRGEQ